MPTTPSRRAVGYLRVSSQEQANEGLSLDAQDGAIRAYCTLRDLDLVRLVRDAGVSGGMPLAQREGGRIILDAVRDGTASAVVAYRLDRLFRDAADCLAVTHQWDQAGVALHLLDLGGQSLDSSSATGRFFLTVMAGAAEMERSLVRERIEMSYAHLRDLRIYHAAVVPWGFERVERPCESVPTGRRAYYIPFEPEAIAVREAYERWLAGASLTEIGIWLAHAGHSLNRRAGGNWLGSRVGELLGNPIYAGLLPVGDRRRRQVAGRALNVEAIVSVSVWEAAHQLLAARYTGRGRAARGDGLLGSLLVCDACGALLWRFGQTRAGVRRYRCQGFKWRGCEQPSVREDTVWAALRPQLLDHLDPRRSHRRHAAADQRRAATMDRLAEIRLALDRLMSVYQTAGARMTETEFVRHADPLWSERTQLEAELATAPLGTPSDLPATRAELRALLERATPPELRALLQRCVSAVRIRDREIVEVRWR